MKSNRSLLFSLTLVLSLLLSATAALSVEDKPAPPHVSTPPAHARLPRTDVQHVVAPLAAEKIAFDRVGGGVLVKLHYKVDKKGYAKYDVHIYKDGYNHKLDVDAHSGMVVKYEMKMPKHVYAPAPVGPVAVNRQQAEQIALSRSGGGTIVSYKLDYEKKTGRPKYDIHVVAGDYKYDYKIDATTGDVFEMKRKSVRIY